MAEPIGALEILDAALRLGLDLVAIEIDVAQQGESVGVVVLGGLLQQLNASLGVFG